MTSRNDPDFTITASKRSVYILLVLTAVTSVICLWPYIFGQKFFVFEDIGVDTYEQYVEQFASLVNHIRTGNWSFWDACNGLGASMFMLDLCNPTLILAVLIGCIVGTGYFMYSLVWLYILLLLAAGVCCYFYLSCFPLSEKAKVISAFVYAFNGYIIVWGQHYTFGFISVIFPLLLLTIERCLHDRRKWPGLVLVSAITMAASFYFGYMSYLFAAFYTIIRCLMIYRFQIRNFASRILAIAGSMILGIGISAFSFFPSAYIVLNVTARLAQHSSLIERLQKYSFLYPLEYYYVLFHKFICSTTYKSYWDAKVYINYYEDPNVFFTLALIIFGFQFLVLIPTMKVALRQKILMYISAVLLASMLIFPNVALIFNGGHVISQRFTFILMPVFAYIIATMYDRNSAWLVKHLPRHRNITQIICAAVAFLIIANSVLNTQDTFDGRDTLMKNNEQYCDEMYGPQIKEALSWLKETDPDYYRVEKDYGMTACMDAFFQNYRSVSSYNSVINGNLQHFFSTIWPKIIGPDRSHFNYRNTHDDIFQTSLLDVKYMISHKESLGDNWELVKQFGYLYVYRNKYDVSLATFYTKTISESAYDSLTDKNVSQLLSEAVITQKSDEFALSAEELSNYQNLSDSSSFGGIKDTSSVKMQATSSDSLLKGTATVSSPGIMMMTIPYEGGWSVYVDGQKQELLKVDYGFIGVRLEPGTHDITVKYESPWLKEGIIITLISILITAVLMFISKKKKQRQIAAA